MSSERVNFLHGERPEDPQAAGPRPRPSKRPGPEGGVRDANRKARLEALHHAAVTLMLARGIADVAVDDVATEAGIAKASFYRYFESKAQLVEAVFAPLRAALEAAATEADQSIASARTEAELLAAYAQLAAALQRVVFSAPREVLLYLQEARGPAHGDRRPVRALADRIAEVAVSLTARAHEHGLLRPMPARISALAVVGAAERLLFDVLVGESSLALGGAAAEHLVSLVMDGLWNR